jgi:hypothetical protein
MSIPSGMSESQPGYVAVEISFRSEDVELLERFARDENKSLKDFCTERIIRALERIRDNKRDP